MEKRPFKYIEFIKEPKTADWIATLDQEELETRINESFKWVALDYFDYVYVQSASSLDECMDYDNDIPCESYQSIGIFRDQEEGEEEKENEDLPFLAVLQITFIPEVYKSQDSNLIRESKEELRELINNAKENFDEEHKTDGHKSEMAFDVYQTVNNVDFCVLIYSDHLDLAEYISATIAAKAYDKNSCKYSVYTTIAISSSFRAKEGIPYMDNGTVLVARVSLKQNYRLEHIMNELYEKVQHADQSNVKAISNTHSLLGKYDLSIRIDGRDNVLKALPNILSFNAWLVRNGKKDKKWNPDQPDQLDIDRNSIDFLLHKDCIRNLNVRVFFCPRRLSVFGNAPANTEGDKTCEGVLERNGDKKDVLVTYNKLKKFLAGYSKDYPFFQAKIDEYMEKLKHIIHTYKALEGKDDTKINMIMLKSYLLSFMDLLMLNAGFLGNGQIRQDDYATNFLSGINYIHQYIKTVTAVNGSSFETPQFGIERDECYIGKLPIAYTEFLGEIFEKYYETRITNERKEDKEIPYNPLYFPLVVPYMHNGESDLYMTTLFSQNMSDCWNETRKEWEKYIANKNNRVLMFIICQDMRQYKNVSELLVASFHELGHYCNFLTRRERNEDLIRIYANVLAKDIVENWVGTAKTGYRTMIALTFDARMVSKLEDSIYSALEAYFLGELKDVMDYPEGVFNEMFSTAVEGLRDVHINCQNKDVLLEDFEDNLYYRAQYEFGLEIWKEKDKEDKKEKKEDKDILRELAEQNLMELEEIKNAVETAIKEKLPKDKNGIKSCLKGYIQYIGVSRELWQDILRSARLKETEFAAKESLDEKIIDKIEKILIWCEGEWKKIKQIFSDAELPFPKIYTEMERAVKNNIQAAIFATQLLDKITNDIAADAQIKRRLRNICKNKNDTNIFVEQRLNKKEKLIRDVFERYAASTENEFEHMTMDTDRYYVLYNQMQITPESGFISGFKEELNQILMGYSCPESTCNLQRTCYVESWADIVMCACLDMDAKEYVIAISDFFDPLYEEESKWKYERIVIVLAYIWYVRCGEQETLSDAFWSKEGFEIEYLSRIRELAGSFRNENYKLLLQEVAGECKEIIVRDRIFDIALRRIVKLKGLLPFIEAQKEVWFIHDFLAEKDEEQGNSPKKNKSLKLQKDEIAFVLKYYYKNRMRYAEEES